MNKDIMLIILMAIFLTGCSVITEEKKPVETNNNKEEETINSESIENIEQNQNEFNEYDIEDYEKYGHYQRMIRLPFSANEEFDNEMHEYVIVNIVNCIDKYKNTSFAGYILNDQSIDIFLNVKSATSSDDITKQSEEVANEIVPLWLEKYNK